MHLALACGFCSKSILSPSGKTHHWQLSGRLTSTWLTWRVACFVQQERKAGCAISHQSAPWSHDASLMTWWIMHVSRHSTMPRCHAFPLASQRRTNSSCKVVSVSSLVARITSAASLWIKTSRTQSTEVHRQQGEPRAPDRAAEERHYLTSEYRSMYLRQLRKWWDAEWVTSAIQSCTCLESLGVKLTFSPVWGFWKMTGRAPSTQMKMSLSAFRQVPWPLKMYQGTYLMRTKLAWQHTKNASDTGLKMAKGSVPWQNNEEEAVKDVFRYPKKDFCKQLKQRYSTS